MIWLAALGGLALGLVIGMLIAGRLNASPSRIRELEARVRQLTDSHAAYRASVGEHFSTTAELVQHMTESYRDVYQHLANGAQHLCPDEVASKLLPTVSGTVFDKQDNPEDASALRPPRDYAAKQSPDQKGVLAEDFGLEKIQPAEDEEIPLQQSQ